MTNGCPKCEELPIGAICIDCRLEYAEWDLLRAMNIVQELKEIKKIKEQENA